MTAFTTSKNVYLSAPLQIIARACDQLGHEMKPLAAGVRIGKTGVVISDQWAGLYLCKSSARGLKRIANEGAKAVLRPADKGQFAASCRDNLPATHGEAGEALALAQARDMCLLAFEAGYAAFEAVLDALPMIDAPSLVKAPSKADKPVKAPRKPAKAPRKAKPAKAAKALTADQAADEALDAL